MSGSLTPGPKTSPRGKKGERTRARLVDAARRVLERDGYLDTRVSDITTEVGMSSGTFYTYFDGKEDVFAAVVDEFQDQLLNPGKGHRLGPEDAEEYVYEANRDYVESVRKNVRLLALFEQVANIDDDFKEAERRRAKEFALQNAEIISRLQEEGRADPKVDSLIAAHALSAMIRSMAFIVYVLGEQIPFEDLMGTLNRLWGNALCIEAPRETVGSNSASDGRGVGAEGQK
jgi:AcrR family transcriptional regulator